MRFTVRLGTSEGFGGVGLAQGTAAAADTNEVLRSSSVETESIEKVMTVPDGFLVRRSGDHWAIAGPTGLFLVARERNSIEQSTERTVLAAHRLRARLAERLDIVPFVDPVVVSIDSTNENHDCAVVEPDLLESFLADGPRVISEGELQLIRHHLSEVVTEIETDGGF